MTICTDRRRFGLVFLAYTEVCCVSTEPRRRRRVAKVCPAPCTPPPEQLVRIKANSHRPTGPSRRVETGGVAYIDIMLKLHGKHLALVHTERVGQK